MLFFELRKPLDTNYSVFAMASSEEADSIVRHFKTESARSVSFEEGPQKLHYYYFIDAVNRRIAPLPFLALIFCYIPGESPIGNMLIDFYFNLSDYSLSFIDYVN